MTKKQVGKQDYWVATLQLGCIIVLIAGPYSQFELFQLPHVAESTQA